MADPIPIRPAEPRDLPAITRIYDHAVRHGTASFEIEPPDEREIARRYEALRAGGYPYLVAELDTEIAGYAYAGPYRAARPIAGASRTRFMLRRPRSGAGSAARCSRG